MFDAGLPEATGRAPQPDDTPEGVSVLPSAPTLFVGDVVPFVLQVAWRSGAITTLSLPTLWESADPGIVSVQADGRATAVAPGTCILSATAYGLRAETTVRVEAATVQSLSIVPDDLRLAPGDTRELRVTASMGNGAFRDVTTLSRWVSSDPTRVSVAEGGRLAALLAGDATVTAEYGGAVARASVRVVSQAVVALSASPSPLMLAAGDSLRLSIRAILENGEERDVSGEAMLASSDTTVLRATASASVAGVAPGTGNLSVVAMGAIISVPFTVTAPRVSSVAVAPNRAEVSLGQEIHFVAYVSYSDGTVAGLSSGVTWSVEDAAVATVDSSGLLRATGVGSTRVAATKGGKTGSAELEVSGASLASLALSPSSFSLYAGETVSIVALGRTADGRTRDVTSGCVWGTSNASVASAGVSGVLALGAGSANISCSFGGYVALASVSVATLPPQVVLSIRPGVGETLTTGGSLVSATDRKAILWSTGGVASEIAEVRLALNSLDTNYPASCLLGIAIHAVTQSGTGSTIPGAELLATPLDVRTLRAAGQWETFVFPRAIRLDAYTRYALVLRSDGAGCKWARVDEKKAQSALGYAYLGASLSADAGGVWAGQADILGITEDNAFEVWAAPR